MLEGTCPKPDKRSAPGRRTEVAPSTEMHADSRCPAAAAQDLVAAESGLIADCSDIGPSRLVNHVCFFKRATQKMGHVVSVPFKKARSPGPTSLQSAVRVILVRVADEAGVLQEVVHAPAPLVLEHPPAARMPCRPRRGPLRLRIPVASRRGWRTGGLATGRPRGEALAGGDDRTVG